MPYSRVLYVPYSRVLYVPYSLLRQQRCTARRATVNTREPACHHLLRSVPGNGHVTPDIRERRGLSLHPGKNVLSLMNVATNITTLNRATHVTTLNLENNVTTQMLQYDWLS